MLPKMIVLCAMAASVMATPLLKTRQNDVQECANGEGDALNDTFDSCKFHIKLSKDFADFGCPSSCCV